MATSGERVVIMDDWANVSLTTLSSGLFECDPTWTMPERTKMHYQLWVITAGTMDFQIGTDAGFVAGQGDVILIPPRVKQRAVLRRHPLETFVIHFMAYDHGVPRAGLWAPRLLSSIPPVPWQRILGDADELNRAMAGSDRLRHLAANAALLDTIAQLEALGPRHVREFSGPQRHPVGVVTAMDYIRRHPSSDLSTRALAERSHVSAESLRVTFKRATGQTPGDYVRQHRIRLAKAMLIETDQTVSSVARAVGFPDAFYFSRLFTTVEGIPPSQFRRSATELARSPQQGFTLSSPHHRAEVATSGEAP